MNSCQQEGFAHDSVLVGFKGEGAQYLDDRWPCLRQEGQQNNAGCEAAQGVPETRIVGKRGIKPLLQLSLKMITLRQIGLFKNNSLTLI